MHLFTYGTLMDADIWLRAAGRPFPREPATLRDYEARALRGVHFPGLIEAPGSLTPGLLYRDVDAPALARLDEYEDDFYQRITVNVTTAAGESVATQVYLMAHGQRSAVLPDIWTPPGH